MRLGSIAALLATAFLPAAALAGSASPQLRDAESDAPFWGDWQGTFTAPDGTERDIAAQIVAAGGEIFRCNLLPALYDGSAPELKLWGVCDGRTARFVPGGQIEPGDVIDTTGQGIVVRSSLLTGGIENGVFTATIAGSTRGKLLLKRKILESPSLGAKPPAGATVLFDGSTLDAWQRAGKQGESGPAQWQLIEGGAMEVRGGSINTKVPFEDCRVHLEFRTPFMPTESGQRRGNSGVYLQGRYEVQVLDSYGLEGLDNECGGIYKVARPRINLCAPPLQWQTYDIEFRAPRFDEAGKKIEDARITVDHNGVRIHEGLKVPGPTAGAISKDETRPGGLLLQDHGNPVRYRNIWIERL